MSGLLNDIEISKKKSPLSMNEIIKNKYQALRPSHGVVAVSLQELAEAFPEVKTELDVDSAAEYLVGVFNAPKSKAFYCDCVRKIKDTEFIRQAIVAAFAPKIQNPPAYFGRICTNKLVKLGIYK